MTSVVDSRHTRRPCGTCLTRTATVYGSPSLWDAEVVPLHFHMLLTTAKSGVWSPTIWITHKVRNFDLVCTNWFSKLTHEISGRARILTQICNPQDPPWDFLLLEPTKDSESLAHFSLLSKWENNTYTVYFPGTTQKSILKILEEMLCKLFSAANTGCISKIITDWTNSKAQSLSMENLESSWLTKLGRLKGRYNVTAKSDVIFHMWFCLYPGLKENISLIIKNFTVNIASCIGDLSIYVNKIFLIIHLYKKTNHSLKLL